MRAVKVLFLVLLVLPATIAQTRSATASDDRLEKFLEVTGFDVALESIRLSAEAAPGMIGLDTADFGVEWARLTNDVFTVEVMHELALGILAETLTDELLTHASDFYASDFGQRIVKAENTSHLKEDDDLKQEMGESILSGLRQIGSPRLEYLERMVRAVDTAENGARALQEVQLRFLLSASGAGVIELRMEEPDLRELLAEGTEDLKQRIAEASISGAAYTYQAFSDDELLAYTEALENETMRQVYELMNAVQYEVMANRFEALAAEMSRLQPSQEL